MRNNTNLDSPWFHKMPIFQFRRLYFLIEEKRLAWLQTSYIPHGKLDGGGITSSFPKE